MKTPKTLVRELYDEHGKLVDKSFTEGLTKKESARLRYIRGQLDSIEACARKQDRNTRQDPAARSWRIFSPKGQHLATVEAVTAYEAWREAHLGGKFHEYLYR
jgi:hypothetical protein